MSRCPRLLAWFAAVLIALLGALVLPAQAAPEPARGLDITLQPATTAAGTVGSGVPCGAEPQTARIARVEQAGHRVDRPGLPVPEAGSPSGPPRGGAPSTPSGAGRRGAADPLAIYDQTDLKPFLQPGSTDWVAEVSAGGSTQHLFAVGNFWAARSADGGETWACIDPALDLPRFCCDQVVIYDIPRNLFVWLRLTDFPSQGSLGHGEYRLSVSTDDNATFCHRTLTTDQTGSPGRNYDFPHLALTDQFLWLTTNEFDDNDSFSASKALKLSLELLAAPGCVALPYTYFTDNTHFTIVPVAGAEDTMYLGTHATTTSLRVYVNQDASPTVQSHDVPLGFTWRRSTGARCGTKPNWGRRSDDRLLAGALREESLYFFWNVNRGAGFKKPHVEGVRLDADTLAAQDRPLIFNDKACVLYPSVAPNVHGDLALVVNAGNAVKKQPSIFASLIPSGDEPAATGWPLQLVAQGRKGPKDKSWGDYNTVRARGPDGETFIAASHYLPTCGNKATDCAHPVFVEFGRASDAP